jgi:hypothetical protein
MLIQVNSIIQLSTVFFFCSYFFVSFVVVAAAPLVNTPCINVFTRYLAHALNNETRV